MNVWFLEQHQAPGTAKMGANRPKANAILGVGVDGPRRHRLCQNEVVVDLKQRGPSVEQD